MSAGTGKSTSAVATVLATILSAGSAQASERAGSAYAYGAEGLSVAPLPPAGTYIISYNNYYTADRLNDGNGHSSVPDFSIKAAASVFRFVEVTPLKVMGATVAMQVVVPVVDIRARAAGARGHRTGVGDIIVTPLILGWQTGQWHINAGADFIIPVGGYEPERLVNLTRNYWTIEPALAITNVGKGRGLDLSLKLMYDFNARNKKTAYRSGNEFHADFAIGYNFVPFSVGINGYYVKQVTDDRQNGLRVGRDGYRGEVLGVGPAVKYQVGPVPISLIWEHEFKTTNRPQGEKFWLKAAFRL